MHKRSKSAALDQKPSKAAASAASVAVPATSWNFQPLRSDKYGTEHGVIVHLSALLDFLIASPNVNLALPIDV
jgi:hypothetical protein